VSGGGGISRRTVLAGAMGLSGLAVLAGIGSPARARADTDPGIHDAFQGLMAFVVPGGDGYSVHQGQTSTTPGGVEAGAAASLEHVYDQAFPFPVFGRLFNINLPGAAGIAALLNLTALAVDPSAGSGPYAAAFANLSYANKAEVFRQLEGPNVADGTPVRFILSTLSGLATSTVYSEAPVFDRTTGQLTGTPVGWQISNYGGVSDGWNEFKGYYRGIDKV
jgi:hypothetical protein